MKILKEKQEWPLAGDNEKTLEIVDGVVMYRFVPQHLHVVTKYYFIIFGFRFLLCNTSKTIPYFNLNK